MKQGIAKLEQTRYMTATRDNVRSGLSLYHARDTFAVGEHESLRLLETGEAVYAEPPTRPAVKKPRSQKDDNPNEQPDAPG